MTVLNTALAFFIPFDPKEACDLECARKFLATDPDCFKRENLAQHFCGSAAIIDPAGTSMLLIHHAKLDRWLQPGGHCDGDPDPLAVAAKEIVEETGVTSAAPVSERPFDIDIHVIPEHKGVPRHEHYDIVYLFTADPSETTARSESETKDIGWFDLETVVRMGDPRLARLARKVIALREAGQLRAAAVR